MAIPKTLAELTKHTGKAVAFYRRTRSRQLEKQRDAGGNRKPTDEQRRLSIIPKERFDRWFQQFWTITGTSTKDHSAPYRIELASRLVQMFSFTGDTVLDPFSGTATTMVAALQHGRNSIGVELDTDYCKQAASRLMNENGSLFGQARFQIELKPRAHSTPSPPRSGRGREGEVSHSQLSSPVALHETSPPYRTHAQKKPFRKRRLSVDGEN